MDRHESSRWVAYAASACGGMFALVSLYWTVGGTVGLDTVGGFAERMARSGTATATLVLALVVVLKCLGAALALALVQRWGRALPRRWLLAAAVAASVLLILYGGVQVLAESLVETGIIRPAGHVDWSDLGWHLGLWDSWFLVWGLLLGAATWSNLGRRQAISRALGGRLGARPVGKQASVEERHQ